MASVLERAIAHYSDRATHTVEVPEWGEGPGKPLVVHFRTPTLATLSKVQTESGGDAVKQMAMLVAQSSLKENGERMFSNMDWNALFREVDPSIVQRIADAIMSRMDFGKAAEQAEKN